MTRLRVRTKTATLDNGVRVTTTKLVKLPELEWRLQAAAVRSLKEMPEYGSRFTLAGDMNAGARRGQEAVKAEATGIAPGEPDMRIYIEGGRLYMIEYKGERGVLSDVQKQRHALLRALGFTVEVVKAATEEEAAARTLDLVRGWLARDLRRAA